ncbi:MAG: MGH1-like glycoside hydrolase domain-containing protein [Planctomycetota bacterium]
MYRRTLAIGVVVLAFLGIQPICAVTAAFADGYILRADSFKRYVDKFNENDVEYFPPSIPNEKAWDFLKANIPLLECRDREIEEIYYFRWWSYRKHIRDTNDGFVIDEFRPKVGWSGKHNTISCAAGHHIYEGRWLHDPKYMNDYQAFWVRNEGAQPRRYSFWAADAYYARYLVQPDKELITGLLDDLIRNYRGWEKERLLDDGLFWQYDVADGMEESVCGSRHRKNTRPTINSYMCADAAAISETAELAGRQDIARKYADKAAKLKKLLQDRLWDEEAKFFKVRLEDGSLCDAREAIGYVPWYFNLPDGGYEQAWRQLMDPGGFYAPFGPTTAEQQHPGFIISYKGDDCQWNGPSWPYSTTQVLVALANVLHNYEQDVVTKDDYLKTLKIYTKSHRRRLDDGRVVPWIDEDLDPYTGQWIARLRKLDSTSESKRHRGKDYNHSGYCDLIITGLIGLRPRPDDIVEVHPLLPDGTWEWFCLDNVLYHGRIITILWDKNGTKYGKGTGLRIYADGQEIAHSETLGRVTGQLP